MGKMRVSVGDTSRARVALAWHRSVAREQRENLWVIESLGRFADVSKRGEVPLASKIREARDDRRRSRDRGIPFGSKFGQISSHLLHSRGKNEGD